jgi:hypothetical protein
MKLTFLLVVSGCAYLGTVLHQMGERWPSLVLIALAGAFLFLCLREQRGE